MGQETCSEHTAAATKSQVSKHTVQAYWMRQGPKSQKQQGAGAGGSASGTEGRGGDISAGGFALPLSLPPPSSPSQHIPCNTNLKIYTSGHDCHLCTDLCLPAFVSFICSLTIGKSSLYWAISRMCCFLSSPFSSPLPLSPFFSSWLCFLTSTSAPLSHLYLFHSLLISHPFLSTLSFMQWNNEVKHLMPPKSRWALQNANILTTQETLRICISKLLTEPTDKSSGPLTPNMGLTRALQSQGKFCTDFEEFQLKLFVNSVCFSCSICITITLHTELHFFPVCI